MTASRLWGDTMTQRPLTARGHHHLEAFCLMQYACKCGHNEIIWNSRDGVTPFAMTCPSCGEADLHHVNFRGDVYAPHHQPHFGQRVWIAMTEERATALATRRIAEIKKRHGDDLTDRLPWIVQDYWRNGEAPALCVQGYDYEHPEA